MNSALGLLVALSLPACDGSADACDPAPSKVEPIGAELFAVTAADETGPRALYRAGARVQLLVGFDGEAEVRATLSEEAETLIDQVQSSLATGQALGSFDGSCLTFVDRPRASLSLEVYNSSLRFSYAWGCPPTGLAEFDAMLRELTDALVSCAPSPLVLECGVVEP